MFLVNVTNATETSAKGVEMHTQNDIATGLVGNFEPSNEFTDLRCLFKEGIQNLFYSKKMGRFLVSQLPSHYRSFDQQLVLHQKIINNLSKLLK